MGLGKKDISNNISAKSHLSFKESAKILNAFLKILKENKSSNIKISNFGSFTLTKTPRRVGRNPKTKEEYEIRARSKISFKASSKVKFFLN